ncbi:MAG TPA: dual specificity protein phosphatase family protein [Verrucomicrobiae bacterium]|nr:dual specificity protein phosphatase family protein [Verrucomicrobiae bacterium]
MKKSTGRFSKPSRGDEAQTRRNSETPHVVCYTRKQIPRFISLAFAGLLTAANLCFAGATNSISTASTTTNRPASWARPLVLPGLTNFYQVTTNLYRGAQPTAEGMRQLKAMGIKTVINLRAFHSDTDEVAGTGLKSIRFETKPWHAEEEDVVGFLKAVTDTNNLPVFVHCERGADRTGTMCAMYRIVVCGWTKPEAIEEMKRGGYHFSPVWKNLVTFIEQADIAEIKRRVVLPGK